MEYVEALRTSLLGLQSGDLAKEAIDTTEWYFGRMRAQDQELAGGARIVEAMAAAAADPVPAINEEYGQASGGISQSVRNNPSGLSTTQAAGAKPPELNLDCSSQLAATPGEGQDTQMFDESGSRPPPGATDGKDETDEEDDAVSK